MKKITLTELKQTINNIYNNKYTIISSYKNNNTPIQIKCNDCGHIENITPKQLKAGKYICKGCSFDIYSLSLNDLDDENWLPIEGYNHYLISNKGRVKILEHYTSDKHYIKESIKKFTRKPTGYIEGELTDDNSKRHWVSMHRLVATAFIYNPDPDNLKEVNHIDGNKENNNEENLEWTNRSGNINHGFDTGLYNKNKAKIRANKASDKWSRMNNQYVLIDPENNRPIYQSGILNTSLYTGLKCIGNTYKKYLNSDIIYRNYYWKTIQIILL